MKLTCCFVGLLVNSVRSIQRGIVAMEIVVATLNRKRDTPRDTARDTARDTLRDNPEEKPKERSKTRSKDRRVTFR